MPRQLLGRLRSKDLRLVTHRLMHLSVFVLSAALSLPAWGTCSWKDEDRHLKISHVPAAVGHYVACKSAPGLHRDIWAVAAPRDSSDEATTDNYDLFLWLEDPTNRNSIAKGHFAGLLSNGGGPKLEGIEIDTGQYVVAPGVRAFGVRARNSMTVFKVPTDGEELSLFVVRGKDIVSVLPHADMRLSYSNRGDDCDEQRRDVVRVLVVDETITNGFRDLLVKETITDSAGRQEASGECRVTPTNVKTVEHRLRYDGRKYVVPSDMREVDCRVC